MHSCEQLLGYLSFSSLFTTRCTMSIARYCSRKSFICPSVCVSVSDVNVPGHMCWVSSIAITRIISLESSLLGATVSTIEPKGNTPKFGCNSGAVALLSRKPAISVKCGKIGPRLLLMTNRKLHTHFQLVPVPGTKINDLG